MTEPTLTINRQLAQEAAENLRRQVHPCEPSAEKVYLRIIEQYLSLTDPTPLNVIQSQALGLEQDDDNEHAYVDGDNPTSMIAVMIGRDHMAISLNVGDPTVGQLRHALLQGKHDGE